ncbi:hypothetical protein M407DRAFT_101145 [Tulasnella calospora MUT 4182]|uniref:Uncharacterized protein n=1 Tax=Tulasnella calospora MUT 4182 TaxID=1051891 RepID=A0A0C3QJZ4_9AGAM|nr:hypothetical protein M407DRAFT_101145 [Tulasnella calospora MUT 4182]
MRRSTRPEATGHIELNMIHHTSYKTYNQGARNNPVRSILNVLAQYHSADPSSSFRRTITARAEASAAFRVCPICSNLSAASS